MLLGIHVEGPFISDRPGAVGCHPAACVAAPSVDMLRQMQRWARGHIKLLTVAAELAGCDALIREARRLGIVVSLGHQLASAADVQRAGAAGAAALTHLGNGMPGQVHRHHNPLLVGLASELHAMIITDGQHLPAHVIKAVLKAKGVDRTIVTSDAVHLAGLPPGRHPFLGREMVLEWHETSFRVSDPERGGLAGSAASMCECANHLWSLGLVTEEELERLVFHNALRLIGVAEEATRAFPRAIAHIGPQAKPPFRALLASGF